MNKKYQMQVLDGGGKSSMVELRSAVMADLEKKGITITLGAVNRGMAAYRKEDEKYKAHCRKSKSLYIMKGKA